MHFPLFSIEKIGNLASLFRQRTPHNISCTAFFRAVGRKGIFYLVDLLPVLIPTYILNLKIICQGEVCKIDKPPSMSIKTLENMTPGKDGKWNIFFQI